MGGLLKFAALAIGLFWLGVIGFVFGMAGLAGFGGVVTAGSGDQPSPKAIEDIPAAYILLYQDAVARFCPEVKWSELAGIGKVETDHGRSPLPGVKSGANAYGAAGPMQIGIGGAAGNSWERVGGDYNDDGKIDIYDPGDAIPGAAKYLCAAGADPDTNITEVKCYKLGDDKRTQKVRTAIWAYNHACWYVDQVMSIAETYAIKSIDIGQAGDYRQAHRISAGSRWLEALPQDVVSPYYRGNNIKCDVRIVAGVIKLMREFRAQVTACQEGGHSVAGEHPLGLAVDVVPEAACQGGIRCWDSLYRMAVTLGWTGPQRIGDPVSCSANGCIGSLVPALRFIGYNNYPRHGDPNFCPPPGCPAHIHLSWNHAPATPFTQASWVMVF
jgi:hypothetical protein